MNSECLIWIPLLPLLGAAINLTVGLRFSRFWITLIGCGAVLGSLGTTLAVIIGQLYPAAAASEFHDIIGIQQILFTWISSGNLKIDFALYCDQLTAVMLFTITFVGFFIHVYSTGYMSHDKSYARFFGYLNLFTGSMLILVLGKSLPVLFVGWEGVGLCSYLLIGFWYDKNGTQTLGTANASAGKKAFIVNRVGDFFFLLGMLLLFSQAGTLDFTELAARWPVLIRELTMPFGWGTATVAGVVGLLLFLGATGKSAQIPLYVWLPDAMAGPTPVSALIHAATMVTAGVYMIVRLNFLYIFTPTVMGLVAFVGIVTALFAATIGFTQRDIKKVLAYSTVSQLGYMFAAVGVGAFSAGVFHLFTHAFFKACLFLGAGAVIHAMHEEQDIFKMGALKKKLPITRMTFLVSSLAIAGIFPFAGFFSKDEILWKALTSVNPVWDAPETGVFRLAAVVYILGLAAAMCTAFYMFRLYTLTFSGESRVDPHVEKHVHEAPASMYVPLIVLACGAAGLGVLGLPEVVGPHMNAFHNWLGPVVEQGRTMAHASAWPIIEVNEVLAHNHALEWGGMALSLAVAIGFSALAFTWYRKGLGTGDKIAKRMGLLYQASLHKYRVDEFYNLVIVTPFKGLAAVCYHVFDRVFIDGIGVSGIAGVVGVGGWLVRRLHLGAVQYYIVLLLAGVGALLIFAGGA